MKMEILLTNNYHDTRCVVRVEDNGTLSLAQAKRAWKKLCGLKGCMCGNSFGEHAAYILDDSGQASERVDLLAASDSLGNIQFVVAHR
jgi:hypothetical protein